VTPRPRRAAWPLAFVGLALLLLVLASELFGRYLERSDLDHGLHARFAQQLLVDGRLLPHFAYHLLLAAAAGFSTDLGQLLLAARYLLALLVLAKLALSLGLARSLTAREGAPLAPATALALGLALFFVAPLPKWWRTENVYLGQLSPTVWHNPTVIALLPLAVAAFWACVRTGDGWRASFLCGALLAASATAKPNFALAFLPAVALLRLVQVRPLGRALAGLACLAAPALAVLGWQYRQALALGLEARGQGVVSLRPLEVWQIYSPHPLASALVSLAFPLAVAAFAARDIRQRVPLVAAWLTTALAVAQFALLAEPEPRLGDANYYWAVVPALYLLFLVSACELLAPRRLSAARRAGRAGCWALLAAHAASGVFLYLHPFQLAVVD
jgi:hypothetical protein